MSNQATDWRIGVDTGGTFTDIVLTGGDGDIRVAKVPSTPENPARALVTGAESILASAGLGHEELRAICHGTTVATNALLQGQIDDLALVVTKGFRHVLEIARQSVPEGYGNSYFWVKPDRIVPVHRVFEVDERLDFTGNVIRELDEDGVRNVARRLKKRGLSAVGVCLIHSYANADHEQRVRGILESEYPELTVSISSDVWPEYREYERAVTTLVDAFVKPHMRRYLGDISALLPSTLSQMPFLVMQSSGGVLSSEQVAHKPIATALSGPAAGVVGASAMARLAGRENIITLDAGGTSTDICLVQAGTPQVTTSASIGPFPVRLPMIDIRTVGTGGGSIAWIGAEGQLRVGPKSAGAEPGPMCYPNGGDAPTITDANAVLGRIPAQLIGGAIALDVGRARAGLAELGKQLGGDMGPERLAAGIIEIANWNQANLIRQMTIEQGIDPRQFALLSFGGSGPAQSPAVMELLGLDACLVPPNPGNLSALGLLMVDYRSDHVFTQIVSGDQLSPGMAAGIYSDLERDAAETLARDGVAAGDIMVLRQADVRYSGQSMEVRVDLPGGAITEAALAAMVENFHAAHERTFGYCYRGTQEIEIVNFCASGLGKVQKPELPAADVTEQPFPDAAEMRQVYFGEDWIDTPIYDRASLEGGMTGTGPMVIQEFGSTTVVFPGQSVSVDGYQILIIGRAP
ncbi:MAG: hydantoinase/oxoprolinase family protein [Rhodospirillaceae bacterium]|nr:hydantoinase/oxoprolinase family protein [Rhodospirillaceae bacterium]MBT6291523.1 hydantoinase/oxoprolinase family protein [Rhodospirillaceae bacterium]